MGRRENSPLTRHVGNPVVKVPPGEKGALTSGNAWGGVDSNHRPADYESAKGQAIYQEELAEEAD